MHFASLAFAALLIAQPVLASSAHAASERACGPAEPAHSPRVVEIELAGVPALLRVPATVSAPPIVLWHGFGPPASEEALMALLPLDEVPAAKVYLGLPMFGKRALADREALARRQAEDLATGIFEPVVMGAARELPRVMQALRREGCLEAGQGIGLFGFSAGGAAVLYVLAEHDVKVDGAVVLNASTGLSASVAAYEHATGRRYDWTPDTRALARQSDAVVRAADIARGPRPPALLIVHGAEDGMVDGNGVHALHRALVPYYTRHGSERLGLETVEGLGHAVQAPADVARVRKLVGEWFLRHAQAATAASTK